MAETYEHLKQRCSRYERKIEKLREKNYLLQADYDFRSIGLERLNQISKELQKTIEHLLRE